MKKTITISLFFAGTALTKDHPGLMPQLYESAQGFKHFINGVAAKSVGEQLTPGRVTVSFDKKLNPTYTPKPKRKTSPLFPGFFYRLHGAITSNGIKGNIDEAVTFIRTTAQNNPSTEITINLSGFSQGAITSLLTAQVLSNNEFPSRIKAINIFAVDPVASPGLRSELKSFVLPASVNNCLLIYATQEKRRGYKPINPADFIYSPSTNIIPISLPCLHADLTDPRNEAAAIKSPDEKSAVHLIKKLVRYIALGFLSKQGISFTTNKVNEAKKPVGIQLDETEKSAFKNEAAYQNKLSSTYKQLQPYYETLRSRRNSLTKQALGGGRKKKAREKLSGLLERKKSPGHFNHHHMALANTPVEPSPVTPISTRTSRITGKSEEETTKTYKHHPSRMKTKLTKAGLLGHNKLNRIQISSQPPEPSSEPTSTCTSSG